MLFFTDTNVNSQVYIGLIMLGGVVVNNAIVLISYYRILMDKGTGTVNAVLKGSRSRLRPILMTTVTTILGLLPMALGIGEGAETQTPLARTVIGGLAFSSILTLFIIPVIFTGLEEIRRQYKARRRNIALMALILLSLSAGFSIPAQGAETQKITLTEAVEMALRNSEAGKIIRLRRENAQSVFELEHSGDKLKVYSEVESSDSKTGESTEVSLTAEKSVTLKNIVGLQSLVDLANESAMKITLLDLEEQESDLIQEVISAYQGEILAKKDLELAEENLERSRRFFDEIMTKSKLGLTSLSDEVGAEAQAAAAETSVNRYRQLYRLARIGLRQLIGVEDEAELELEPVASVIDPDELVLETLRHEALSKRADLRKAQEDLDRSGNLLKLARLSQRVGITLNWSLEKDDFETGVALTNQNEGQSGEWRLKGNVKALPFQDPERIGVDPEGTLKLSLRWTLFDGKARRERVKQAELLFEQKTTALSKLQKSINYDVEGKFFNYQNKRDQVKNGGIQVRSKRIYLDATEAKSKMGLASVKEVLDAQADHHQALVDYEKYKGELFLAEIELLRVTGRLRPGMVF
jgi:outer membrane protein TolC